MAADENDEALHKRANVLIPMYVAPQQRSERRRKAKERTTEATSERYLKHATAVLMMLV